MTFDLLTTVEAGGCSAKIAPSILEEMLAGFPVPVDPDILVDISTHDDAGVYRLTDDIALVLTTDFFPPVCSDAYEFGQIAAANSLSDVYAMGGKPILALNLIMFPSLQIPIELYGEILRGGNDKAGEAGVSIIGGHSIDDYPPKYGLAVTGIVHPDRVITNSGARAGDVLILTKPVGSGVLLAASRMGMATEQELTDAKSYMKQLNNEGCRLMQEFNIKGATDITGFGLAGHALKMALGSEVTIRLSMKNVPLMNGAYSYINEGCIPGAAFRNLDYIEKQTLFENDLDYNLRMASCDAQTSGGLLISVKESDSEKLLSMLKMTHIEASIIGNVEAKGSCSLIIGN
jgi:selenide, water dikinase